MDWRTQDIKKTLAQQVIEGVCGTAMLDLLVSGDKCAPVEGDLLDYKESVNAVDPIAIAEVCKDIVAFHNTYGGYLVIGVAELELEEFRIKGIREGLNVEQLKNKLRDFTGERIEITQALLPVTNQYGEATQIAISARTAALRRNATRTFSKRWTWKGEQRGFSFPTRGYLVSRIG